ncbi:hypothetical protein LCGC14_2826230, partial [marine sediment metagenome]
SIASRRRKLVELSLKIHSHPELGFKELKASAWLARTEGTFICPEGAANLSAAMKLRESGWIKSDERVVLLNTGSGLKYPETVTVTPPVLLPGDKLPVS